MESFIFQENQCVLSFKRWLTHLLPGDTRYRSANRTSHENNRFSLFYIRCCESFHEFWRDNLFFLDHVQVTLERGFASLVPSDTGHDAGVRAAHVRDHQWIITRLVHEDLVGQVVGYLLTVYVPCHLGIRTAGYATVKPESHVLFFHVILNFFILRTVST